MEQVIEKLKKEQSILSNSINQLKQERDLLKNNNKLLEDQISSKEANLLRINSEEKEAIVSRNLVVKDAELLEVELNNINTNRNNGILKLAAVNNEIIKLQETYDKNKKDYDKLLNALELKYQKETEEIEKEFEKIKIKLEKEKNEIEEKIAKIEKEEVYKQAIVDNLKKQEKDLEQNIFELEKEKNRLENIIQQGNELSLDLISKNESIENLIKENGEVLNGLNNEIKQIREELSAEGKRLNKMLGRIGFIQKKEDSLKSFEAYIIEISNKYGLEYQPYEGQN